MRNKKFSTFGYDRPESGNVDIKLLGADYDKKRFIPLFEGYQGILTHIIENHSDEQVKLWGWSREFMKWLLKTYFP